VNRTHEEQLRLDLAEAGVPLETIQRFVSKVIFSDGCWVWRTGLRASFVESPGSIATSAYRVIYVWLHGPQPGLDIDHQCENPPCVRPSHLLAMPHADNIRKGRTPARQTFCLNGHEFDEANTYWYTNAKGRPARQCRKCNVERKSLTRSASALK